MFVNERTFFPVFVPLAPATSLLRRFPVGLHGVLERLGVDPRFVASEIQAMSDACVAKTADRRVLGVMNELAFQADIRVRNGFDPSDLTELSVKVSGVLLSPLFKDRGGHGSPDATLRALVAELTT